MTWIENGPLRRQLEVTEVKNDKGPQEVAKRRAEVLSTLELQRTDI